MKDKQLIDLYKKQDLEEMIESYNKKDKYTGKEKSEEFRIAFENVFKRYVEQDRLNLLP